ncbi:septum formation initiator family protein [Patescibacteria group bacterium]|nr:septum formation initiator family protein [Patescibacteria group bacterium]MBU1895934.1 septum formation initiator family protein [Patescibacteria group bacterium]
MEEKTKQSMFKSFFGSRLFLLFSLVIMMLVAFGYARGYYQDFKIKEEIRQLEEEVKSLETKKIESLDILQYVTSDDFIEEKARTELNLKKPGEKVVVFDRKDESYEERDNLGEDASIKNPKKWLNYFLHKDVDSIN